MDSGAVTLDSVNGSYISNGRVGTVASIKVQPSDGRELSSSSLLLPCSILRHRPGWEGYTLIR